MVSGKLVLAAIVAFGIAGALGFAGDASAATKKKVTYEQAWKLCKAELDKEKIPTTTDAGTNERYLRGGACMKKYGYGF